MMSRNMVWQAEGRSFYDEGEGSATDNAGLTTYNGQRPSRANNQDFLSYDEEPGQLEEWTGDLKSRSLEERITAVPPQEDSMSSHTGFDGTV